MWPFDETLDALNGIWEIITGFYDWLTWLAALFLYFPLSAFSAFYDSVVTRPVITVSLTSDKVTINSKQVALGGSLSLTADDIPNGLTNKWYTDADARAAVGPMYTDADARAAVGPIDTAPTANTIVKRTAAGGMHGTHVSNSAFTLDLTNNKTLLATDLTSNIGVITTSGTGKVLVMPVSTNCSGMWVVLRNKGANSVIIRDSFGDPITTLNSSSIVSLICDGEDWLLF